MKKVSLKLKMTFVIVSYRSTSSLHSEMEEVIGDRNAERQTVNSESITNCEQVSAEPLIQFILQVFFVSNFRRVLNVVCFLLGKSQASEVYMPTFRNTPFRNVGI